MNFLLIFNFYLSAFFKLLTFFSRGVNTPPYRRHIYEKRYRPTDKMAFDID